MKKPHAGFWLATLGLGVCWLLALLTRDRLNGILLAGAALALILPPPPAAKARPWLPGWHRHGWALELQRRAALQRATRPAALGHRALDRLRLLVVLAAGRGQSGPWPLAVLGAAVGLRLRRVLEAGRLAARRATGVHAAAAGGRLVDLSARRQLAAVETTGQLNGGQRPGKIMPQAIAYRLPDRVY